MGAREIEWRKQDGNEGKNKKEGNMRKFGLVSSWGYKKIVSLTSFTYVWELGNCMKKARWNEGGNKKRYEEILISK